MARVGPGESVPSWRHPRLQPLHLWHFNLPFQSLPKGFLVPGQFSRKTLHHDVGTQPFPHQACPSPDPQCWPQGHPIPPRFLSDSLPGPCPLPLSEGKLEGKAGGVGAQA